jgi:hypothetical protein
MSTTTGVLFSDNFGADTAVDPTKWAFELFVAPPGNNSSFFGDTQIRQNLPSIDNGAAHLTIDTYNPTGPGQSFVGTDIYTQQTFVPGPTGIVFTVTAELDQREAGLVAGIFPYTLLDPTTTDHNEIDTELVSNDPADMTANIYNDQPLGAGNPMNVAMPAGAALTQLNTYQMVWTTSKITWYVNGKQVADTASNVPTGAMPLYLDFWVPAGVGNNAWPYAYNPALQPVSTAAADTTYGFDVSSVSVTSLVPGSGSATLPAATSAYEAILRTAPIPATIDQAAAQIDSSQTTLAAFENSLIDNEQTMYTTLPALVTIDAFYGATPQSVILDGVAASTGSPSQIGGFYSAAYLHSLGYSDANVWTIMASQWGADQTSGFFKLYNSFGSNYSGFISAVYQREFGFAPTAANLRNLVNDIPGVQSLLGGGSGAATPIQVVSGIYGYLLEVGQTTPSLTTQYATAANAFLLAAANGTVSYGPELTTEFSAGSSTVTDATASVLSEVDSSADARADPGVITITGSDQLIDPGTGSHIIQFLTGAGADTVVLHTGGVDQISGFDPATDVLNLQSLLVETGLDLTRDVSALSNYVTIVDQGTDAILRFDPTGQGGGSAVAILQGLSGSVTGLKTLIADGAIHT